MKESPKHQHSVVRNTTTGALLLVMLLLGGCGFHLRGTINLPPELQNTYLQAAASNGELARQVRAMLKGSGVTVVATLEEASAHMTLSAEERKRTVIGVNSAGKASDFLLLTTFSFSVSDRAGEPLLAEQDVKLERTFSFDNDQVLSSSNVEATLWREMRRMAVRKMFNRIRITMEQQKIEVLNR